MVLSKIAKGEIIQSGYLKKHLGMFNLFRHDQTPLYQATNNWRDCERKML